MKKWLIVMMLLFTFLLTGCTKKIKELDFKQTKNFQTLNEVTYPDQQYLSYYDIDGGIVASDFNYLQKFANDTSKLLFVNSENYIYSPMSLYMALGMLAQGAEGQTLDELLLLLQGNTIKTLDDINIDMNNIYNHNYYSNKDGMARMANSIWINKTFSVKNDFLEDLRTNYYAEVYHTNFNDEGKENIAEWINHYTENLLNIKKDNYPISENTALMLINTVYFDNKWEEEFKTKDNFFDSFYGDNITNVEYMKHTNGSTYFEYENCEIFYDYFKNNNCIKFIFPKENSSVEECLNSDMIGKILNYEDGVNVELTLSIPKFKTNSSYTLNDVLSNLGLNSIFNDGANFSKISNNDLYVSFVKQDAGIILNEEGVKAAAVTGIGMVESAAPGENISIILNRPFIYVITDSHNVPLFVGVVNNPTYK